MKKLLFLFILLIGTSSMFGQTDTTVKGLVISSSEGTPLESVNIVNINEVKGAITNSRGEFEIKAKATDTLHFSYLGYKSIRVRVTNDWIKYGSSTITLTELAFALEEVVINEFKLTGFLEVDIKQVIPLNTNYRYSISGLETGYEAGGRSSNAVTRVLGAVFNPADFLHSMFGKQPNEMRKLKQMKQDDEIRTLLANRFDREMLVALLQVNRVDLDEIIRQCNYSKSFIETANDLQILDAISECYEEYRVLSRNRKYGKL
ncbi:carboxypeptidase-like regulatory domain-containing protein [Xanthomarina sp.]|uniref:carboxypeptidase-like regulatory domain-containing protein n=1 Tax=Xanthomarina sp. TaxID=1931211 RepID=UPI002B73EE64|nr:carboxypeptidase-like regulatory domain-containing protein [Xanthomarina sp.]HLV38443.1 carboxypeptidase-like regulatory domain-containing protein [Xanthomarina sp.]